MQLISITQKKMAYLIRTMPKIRTNQENHSLGYMKKLKNQDIEIGKD